MEYIFLYTLFSQLISDRSKWYAHTHTHDTQIQIQIQIQIHFIRPYTLKYIGFLLIKNKKQKT